MLLAILHERDSYVVSYKFEDIASCSRFWVASFNFKLEYGEYVFR